MDNALLALEAVDFQWAAHTDSVWRNPIADVAALHESARAGLTAQLDRMSRAPDHGSPLGWVLRGDAGAGKTHLLSAFRREAISREAAFVFVDLTDVHDFWDCVLLGFLDSLQKQVAGADDQCHIVLHHLAEKICAGSGIDVDALRHARPPGLANQIDRIVKGIARHHRAEMHRHQDVLRALVLLNSDEFELSNLGHAWLQGHGLGEEEMLKWGFDLPTKRPLEVVRGLSWILGLRAPTVLALDQLDAIVTEHNLLATAPATTEAIRAQQHVSRSIIEGLGRGLMELRDVTRRTLTVVSCVEATWQVLESTALRTATDRYEPPRTLSRLQSSAIAESLVAQRLAASYSACGFTAPYPTWPFAAKAFSVAGNFSPRQLLKRCDGHRRACIERRSVFELVSFADAPAPAPAPSPSLEALDRAWASACAQHASDGEPGEEDLGILVGAACRSLRLETPPGAGVELFVDEEFDRHATIGALLHARVRVVLEAEGDRERHASLRVIEQKNAVAYQARLKAAMTRAGIDRELGFRRLFIVRSTPLPAGEKSQKLTQSFTDAGGQIITPSPDERRTLAALGQLLAEHAAAPGLEAWLRARRPASSISCLAPLVACLREWSQAPTPRPSAPPPVAAGPETPPPAKGAMAPAAKPVHDGASGATAPTPQDAILPIGHQVVGDRVGSPQTLPARNLREHMAVLAGAGSGKTVFLRRLVEEAALLGIPSIVIDCANDLARLGDPWPQPPEGQSDADRKRAVEYFRASEVVVWTPGREAGNPLSLAPLPDLAQVAGDPDELSLAVRMATDALADIAAPGDSEASRMRQGVLAGALEFFAHNGGGDLGAFVELLKDLPPQARAGISKADQLALKMADSILAAIRTNPILRQTGTPLDPGVLFQGDGKRTRISVVSLIGLPGLSSQQQFVNQLAMTLFTWVKRNPCPPDRPLRGLLVLDEARDFVPSQSSTPCKGSILRLAAQGRKYGLGLVVATQTPKGVDHNVIANCSTHLYGKASSAAAISVVQDQIQSRGGSGADVPRLGKGRFYFYTNGMLAPEKVAVPLCLSHHPTSPLDENEVLRRAERSRNALGRT